MESGDLLYNILGGWPGVEDWRELDTVVSLQNICSFMKQTFIGTVVGTEFRS